MWNRLRTTGTVALSLPKARSSVTALLLLLCLTGGSAAALGVDALLNREPPLEDQPLPESQWSPGPGVVGSAAWMASKLPDGTPAPDFTLPRLTDRSAVTLSAFRGHKPVVLIFGSFT
jgi:hypothetical protein